MRSLCLTIALCLFLACLAAADVSHLPSSYLPPPKPEHAVSMSIEQQELQELPEQVEYMRENEQGVMEAMPSSLLTPPAPLESEQIDGTPSSRYLPPAPQPQPQMEQQPLIMQKLQMEIMAPEQHPEQPQIAMRYLPPPAPASEEPQQLTYQQYQEQIQMQMQEQQQQQAQTLQEEQMPYYMDVQQPMAPTDAEAEPEPAHELRSDGYHYKQAAEELRLRH